MTSSRDETKRMLARWRQQQGMAMPPLGWDDGEAARLAGISPASLASLCARGWVRPHVTRLVLEDVENPLWAAGDLIAARTLHDLDGAVDDTVRALVADSFDGIHNDSEFLDIRQYAKQGWWMFLLRDSDVLEAMGEDATEEAVVTYFDEDKLDGCLPDSERGPDQPWHVYPVCAVATEIIERIDEWWFSVGTPKRRRPEWL